ncbi:NYN domain-containing protein [Halobacteriales archaeon QH_7_65_31]|nr:MAG: NYN domain-containing protein [Halobacteriales archaeon QH_7_65_31]
MDEPARVGVFVDGPNVFREEFDVDLNEVRETATAEGQLAVKRLYLDDGAPPELIRAAEARGFEVTVTSGDVDVKLAVDLTEFVATGDLDTVVVVSRDTDFKPAVEVANRRGLRTVAVAPGEHGRSDALANAAHGRVTLGDATE